MPVSESPGSAEREGMTNIFSSLGFYTSLWQEKKGSEGNSYQNQNKTGADW